MANIKVIRRGNFKHEPCGLRRKYREGSQNRVGFRGPSMLA